LITNRRFTHASWPVVLGKYLEKKVKKKAATLLSGLKVLQAMNYFETCIPVAFWHSFLCI
jgi:hypothetical protein